ncbi:hypothetical protein [Trinickia diaoshuihuensis]|jgi:hypothetical protein|uniref:hypothetical protein n=1 Tax=Trinickia diaoshuihuensis TaxID=2292265 RepID=UPI000E21C3AE|nr:hypothetical protein [Trinickia diaoshuihuensis]
MKTYACKSLVGQAMLSLALQSLVHPSFAGQVSTCDTALRQLIVAPLHSIAMKKENVRVALEDSNDGVYSVRLFVAADSPDNRDKYVTIGWVNLDTNTMKAFDVTDDPDNPVTLNVDVARYRSYVDRCLPRQRRRALLSGRV